MFQDEHRSTAIEFHGRSSVLISKPLSSPNYRTVPVKPDVSKKKGAGHKPTPNSIMLWLLAQQRLSLSYYVLNGVAKLF